MTPPRKPAATCSREGEAVAVAVASSTLAWRRPQQERQVQACPSGLLVRANNLSVSALFIGKVCARAPSWLLEATSGGSMPISACLVRGPNLRDCARTQSSTTTLTAPDWWVGSPLTDAAPYSTFFKPP